MHTPTYRHKASLHPRPIWTSDWNAMGPKSNAPAMLEQRLSVAWSSTEKRPILQDMSEALLTVYHDGSCPLCRREIGMYRNARGAEHIRFVDVSASIDDPAPDLSRQRAMTRFHVRLPSGELRSGAAAFIALWRLLPRWRPAAIIAGAPGGTSLLEVGYRLTQPLRPIAARVLGRFG